MDSRRMNRIVAELQQNLSKSPFRLLFLSALLFIHAGCQKSSVATNGSVVHEEMGRVQAPQQAPVPLTSPVELGPKGPQAAPVAAAEKPQPAGPTTVGRAPTIRFEQVVYDFGEVPPGVSRIGRINFSNAGNASLKITQVKPCCGTVAKLSKYDYAPGESGVLELEYRSGVEPGVMRRQVSVYSNDPQNPEVSLTIAARIVRVVDYEPKRLKLFLKQENAGCGEITLSSLDGKPFSITGFHTTADAITADFDPSVEAAKFVLKPKANLETLQKNLKGRINITLSHSDCDSIDMLFDVLPQFTVNPPQIILFKIEPGKPIKRSIWVLSNYGDDFEIESISSQNNTIKVTGQQKVGNRYQLEVEITPPSSQDKQKLLTDVLSVTMRGGEKLSITCRGFY